MELVHLSFDSPKRPPCPTTAPLRPLRSLCIHPLPLPLKEFGHLKWSAWGAVTVTGVTWRDVSPMGFRKPSS